MSFVQIKFMVQHRSEAPNQRCKMYIKPHAMSECLANFQIIGGNIKGNCVWNEIQMAMSMCIQFRLPAIAQGHTNRPSMANNVCFDWNDSFDVSLMFHTSQAVFSSSLIACLHQKKKAAIEFAFHMSGHVSGLSFCLFSPEKRRHRVLSLNRMI